MKTLPKLLFELANNERIMILLELQKQKLKLSRLPDMLNLTLSEASRHLERLSNTKLIQRDPNGSYELAPLGSIMLTLLPSLDFVYTHENYFRQYSIDNLPYEFVERIGELAESVYVAETFQNLAEGEKRIREAKEFIWILSDQVLTSSIPSLSEKVTSSFDLRIILPRGMFPPESESRLPLKMSVKKRVLPKVNTVIVLTEKYAIFCLPNRSGKIDYTGFQGEDPRFHKWCKDLFLHYWEKSEPVNGE
jgi:predicted transcriptional regulator